VFSFLGITLFFVLLQVMAHSTPEGILDDVAMVNSTRKSVYTHTHTHLINTHLIYTIINHSKLVKSVIKFLPIPYVALYFILL